MYTLLDRSIKLTQRSLDFAFKLVHNPEERLLKSHRPSVHLYLNHPETKLKLMRFTDAWKTFSFDYNWTKIMETLREDFCSRLDLAP